MPLFFRNVFRMYLFVSGTILRIELQASSIFPTWLRPARERYIPQREGPILQEFLVERKKENIFFTWVGPKILESPPVRYYVINPNIYEKVECRKKGLFIEAGGCTFKRGVPVFEWVKKWSHIWVGIKGKRELKQRGMIYDFKSSTLLKWSKNQSQFAFFFSNLP